MDTAQPVEAAENVAHDSIGDAAHAFKVALGQEEPKQDRPRDDMGRFASTEAEEIDAEAQPADETEQAPADDGADEQDDTQEAPEEGQPEAVELPASWSKEDAELWSSLPPEAQAKIAEREGQREVAVNQKFQEAASDRKMAQAIASEASASREQAMAVMDQMAQLLIPEKPPVSMLDRNSRDYNPDEYHLLNTQYEESVRFLQDLGQQRQTLAAQHQAEAIRLERQVIDEIESICRPKLFSDVPDLQDETKRPALLQELVQYAVENHIPADQFAPENAWRVTSAELRILWKAQQYDRLQAAKAKVQVTPKPKPKPAPAVRPGVATPKGAIEQTKFRSSLERLATEGSVEAGAAVFKHFMKGR